MSISPDQFTQSYKNQKAVFQIQLRSRIGRNGFKLASAAFDGVEKGKKIVPEKANFYFIKTGFQKAYKDLNLLLTHTICLANDGKYFGDGFKNVLCHSLSSLIFRIKRIGGKRPFFRNQIVALPPAYTQQESKN
jgi:hypothetical protein